MINTVFRRLFSVVEKVLRKVGLPLALALLLRQIWVVRDQVSLLDLQINPYYIILAFIMFFFCNLFWAILWHWCVSKLGNTLSLKKSLYIYFSSYLLKYIPGQIWAPLKMSVLNREFGANPESSFIAYTIVQVCVVLNTCLFIAILGKQVSWFDSNILGNWFWWIVIIFLVVFLFSVIFLPDYLSRFNRLNFLKSSRRLFLNAFLISVPFYIFTYFWFYFFYSSFSIISFDQILDLVVVGLLSDMATFIVFFAPSGIGVREISFSKVLTLAFSLPVASAIRLAVLLRIFTTVADLLMCGIILLIFKVRKMKV